MSTLDAPAVSQRDQSQSRTRSPSPSDQLRPTKRPRPSQLPRFSPPLLANRSPSASSIATSIEQHDGIGDQDALGNLLASYPQTFSSFPRPHGSGTPWTVMGASVWLRSSIGWRERRCRQGRIQTPALLALAMITVRSLLGLGSLATMRFSKR